MGRMLIFAAATALLAACGADQGDREAAGEPPAANETAPAPSADNLAAPPEAGNAAGTAVPSPAPPTGDIPAAFQGVYDSDREGCGRPSEYRLTVAARELRFHESIGAVRSVAVDGPDLIRVTADYQGEGESWTNVRTLRLADGGATLTITGEGISLTRVRCPALPTGS